MTDTEWTPERRKEYELKREGARRALLWQCRRTNAEQVVAAEVDELYPPPPSEYTYGPEVKEPWTTGHSLRRRSDGRWEFRSHLDSEWYELERATYDAHVRLLAAEVPLSDAECHHLIWVSLANYTRPQSEQYSAARDAITRVLRGEVKGNG